MTASSLSSLRRSFVSRDHDPTPRALGDWHGKFNHNVAAYGNHNFDTFRYSMAGNSSPSLGTAEVHIQYCTTNSSTICVESRHIVSCHSVSDHSFAQLYPASPFVSFNMRLWTLWSIPQSSYSYSTRSPSLECYKVKLSIEYYVLRTIYLQGAVLRVCRW